MALRYSVVMRPRQTLPRLWLISDARNDAVLEASLRRLPRGSGLIFRHYHLSAEERAARFGALVRLCRGRGHMAVLAADPTTARRLGATGSYGNASAMHRHCIAGAHSLKEIARANRQGAAAIMLSPVFPTRSHPGAAVLGPVRFRLLASRALAPVIALGGMNRHNTARTGAHGWAAIDGLSLRQE